MKKLKFNFDKIADAINYYDKQFTFFKGDGEELDYDELFEKGMTEDDFPWTIKEFKKLGYGFSKEEFECHENDRTIWFTFDNNDNMISIESQNFTIKECFTVVNMVRKHLECNRGKELFVAFGNFSDDNHSLYHGESTAFDMWIEDFHKLYVSRLEGENKLSKIVLLIEDYQTDDERYYTKDRVIHIVLV